MKLFSSFFISRKDKFDPYRAQKINDKKDQDVTSLIED